MFLVDQLACSTDEVQNIFERVIRVARPDECHVSVQVGAGGPSVVSLPSRGMCLTRRILAGAKGT